MKHVDYLTPCDTKGCHLCLGHPGRHQFKSSKKEERIADARFTLADRFTDEVFAHKDLCGVHDFTEVLAIALAGHLKNIARYESLEDLDNELAKFTATLSTLTERDHKDPDQNDVPQFKLTASIRIER